VKQEALTRWTIEDAAELYAVRDWGLGYFDISRSGHAVAKIGTPENETEIDLVEIIEELKREDFNVPILIRFADILCSQINRLNLSFKKAMREAKYKGSYRCVYPIKVNQKYPIVKDILEFGRHYHHGLEAGSKAELIAAIAATRDPNGFIICNGYKDEEFIDLALHALKIGLQTIIVVEMPGELDLVINRARKLKVTPRIGVRAKLSSRAGGHWDKSGGDRSKFGLNSSQIIDLLDILKKEHMLDCLQMLHYHLGSQVPDIRKVRTALQEACGFYVNLVKEGAPMGIINIGGGLAVDYDGSHTNFASSRNYKLNEYASDVVEVIMRTMNDAEVPHPMIVSESGRATVAHHSVLVFNALDVRRFAPKNIPEELPESAHEMLRNIMEARNSLTPRNVQEVYHDAIYYRDEIRSLFMHGHITLRERALAENIFWHIIMQITSIMRDKKYVPDEMEGLEPATADVYYCNFSLFQSLSDSWAIDQLFPIMPINRLNERPTSQAIIADITCDSDGQIDKFIDLRDVKHVLRLHELNDEEYYIGVFLVGAYQETLGDMHNLLGEINVVHVRVKDGEIVFSHEAAGDSVQDTLKYVEYEPKKMLNEIKRKIARAQRKQLLTQKESEKAVKAFTEGMTGYTYFEK